MTYYFIPDYGAVELEDSDAYLPLSHACLRPSREQLGVLQASKEAKSAPYTMFEIIDSADNYCMNEITGRGRGDGLDDDQYEDDDNLSEEEANGLEEGPAKALINGSKSSLEYEV